MKKLVLASVIALSSSAFAQAKIPFAGSTTVAGVIEDAINASAMQDQLQYIGGGSGAGEKALVAGDQGIAPMSRAMTQDAKNLLAAKGASVVEHVIGLDGLSIFVKSDNSVPSLDLQTIGRIYSCEFTKWEQIPNSGKKGAIKPYRRDDQSGTTDAFKAFTGLKAFGNCTIEVATSDDVSEVTSRDVDAIGYAGLSAKRDENREVALSAKAGNAPVLPTTATIRDFSYPMSRNLYVYEVSGARKPNATEQKFLNWILDPSNLDPIMQAHDFITTQD